MKKTLLFLLLLLSIGCTDKINGGVYFVAPNGSNTNNGAIDAPFATLQYALNSSSILPGDIIYVRGGVYKTMGFTSVTNKNGTADALICVWNYPGEKPVIDYIDVVVTTGERGIRLYNCSYLFFKGIEIKNLKQELDGTTTNTGLYLAGNVTNCYFENMNIHHIGGWAVQSSVGCDKIYFINCDFHHTSDPYSSTSAPYDGSDGFQSATTDGSLTFIGCRSYWNSDDGWDLLKVPGFVTFINCWSFLNGYIPGVTDKDADRRVHGGNGEGFKLGFKPSPNTTNTLRRLQNCIAAENYLLGFHHYTVNAEGEYEFRAEIFNNTAANNGSGGGFNFGGMTVASDLLRNNLSYVDRVFINSSNNASNNSWNLPVTVTADDFVSVDYTELMRPRKADGSLPDINYMKIKQGSDLIDKGVIIEGIVYYGEAPDLGAFEYRPPTLAVSDTLYANDSCTAELPDYTNIVTVEDNCKIDSIIQQPKPGYLLDSNNKVVEVYIRAYDISSNVTEIHFPVILLDTIPPVIKYK